MYTHQSAETLVAWPHRDWYTFYDFVGGSYGRITVSVQTIGGGETWDNLVGVAAQAGNETVGQVLAGREPGKRAVAGQDYQILDQTVIFEVKH